MNYVISFIVIIFISYAFYRIKGSNLISKFSEYAEPNNTLKEFNLQNINQLKTTYILAFANKTFYYK